jgi:RNA polymerase sigma factor (sigma-70 family)
MNPGFLNWQCPDGDDEERLQEYHVQVDLWEAGDPRARKTAAEIFLKRIPAIYKVLATMEWQAKNLGLDGQADEACDAVFFKLTNELIKQPWRFSSVRAAAGWTKTVFINGLIDTSRPQANRRTVAWPEDKNGRSMDVMDRTSPTDEASEQWTEVLIGMSQLEESERNLLVHRYLEGKGVQETADQLGVSVSTITRRHAVAIEKLQRLIQIANKSP